LSKINDDRVVAIEQALMFALSLNARPDDTWGNVKKAVGLVCAEVISDHELLCGCGFDHAPQDREFVEAILVTAKTMLKMKLEEKAAGKPHFDLANAKPEGSA
jgi:hypothetical protein